MRRKIHESCPHEWTYDVERARASIGQIRTPLMVAWGCTGAVLIFLGHTEIPFYLYLLSHLGSAMNTTVIHLNGRMPVISNAGEDNYTRWEDRNKLLFWGLCDFIPISLKIGGGYVRGTSSIGDLLIWGQF